MRRKKRNPANEFDYRFHIESWDISVRFNDYAYLNLDQERQLKEKFYLKINGYLSSSSTKKIKKGMPSNVVLHFDDYWYNPYPGTLDDPIGEIIIVREQRSDRRRDCLVARIGIPTKSYELIRSYLTYKVKGEIHLLGTDLLKREAKIFYFSFRSDVQELG